MDTGTLHEREPPACLDLGEAHHKVNVFNAYEFNVGNFRVPLGVKMRRTQGEKSESAVPQ